MDAFQDTLTPCDVIVLGLLHESDLLAIVFWAVLVFALVYFKRDKSQSSTMDTSQFLLSPIGSLPCSPSPLAARFTDNFDLPPSCKSEFADNISAPPAFCDSLSPFRFPVEKSAVRSTQFSSRNPYRQGMSTSPPRLRRIRTLDLEEDVAMPRVPVPSSSRSPSPPPYGYCETFDSSEEEDDISTEEHAILAARSRAIHAERVAKYHEQELSFRIRSLRASRSQPSSPSSLGQTYFSWNQSPSAIEDPVTEAEYRRARAEMRRRRRSERMRVVELGNLLEARRARLSPPHTPPPSYDSESALGLGLGLAPPATSPPQADQIVARMILKRRESASFRVPNHGLEHRRSSSSLRFEALSL
ncbi:hypothetical protein RhiLY_13030 [Ceratobasidium sp. AG-Ba]|nr:hypothetical protein RhiLY_13030 [Ceratobasidium sp. AG-Ba]